MMAFQFSMQEYSGKYEFLLLFFDRTAKKYHHPQELESTSKS